MLKLSVTAASTRRFLRGGRSTNVHVRLNNPAHRGQDIPIADLLALLLRKDPDLIPPLSKKELRNENGKTVYLVHNFRGRPSESFSLSNPNNAPKNSEPREEEVFHSDGSILVPPDRLDEFPETIETLQRIPFQYRVGSRFERFDDSGEIVHRLESESSQAAQDLFTDFEVRRAATALPIRLDQIRLGFERYETRFLGASFGFMPSIRSRLYLEMTGERIYLFLEEEGLSKRDELPFARSGTLQALEEGLEEFELYFGLGEALKQSLNR